jgi:hypothetical protein
MLYSGDGIGQDVPEAIRLWTVAADGGNAYAQFYLAEMYMDGIGVPRDLGKAQGLFKIAGKTLDVTKQMKELSLKMDANQVVNLPLEAAGR